MHACLACLRARRGARKIRRHGRVERGSRWHLERQRGTNSQGVPGRPCR
nr:hypothetical protein RVX_1478 [Nitratidesulfovibrio sp. HK-II]